MSNAPALPEEEIRRRYADIVATTGPIEELPGERTLLGRCFSVASLLDYGAILADHYAGRPEHRDPKRWPEPRRTQHRMLVDLVLAAWPTGSAGRDEG